MFCCMYIILYIYTLSNNKMLQVLDKFKLLYLGSVLQNNATAAADKEIASRIQKAASNFHKLYQRV